MQVHVNGRRAFPTFSNNDFIIRSTGIELRMDIPDIKTTVVFKGSTFYITLPNSLFHGNTEGHCGKNMIIHVVHPSVGVGWGSMNLGLTLGSNLA